MTDFTRILAAAALGLAFASGASAQNGPHRMAKSAPLVAVSAAMAALDAQLQQLTWHSRTERRQLAARIVEICNRLAQMDGSPSGKIESGYVIAAGLYRETDFPAAKAALVRAAEFASARGEVFDAANRYLDAGLLTMRQRVRTPDDAREARKFYLRARRLASSSLLSPQQRAYLLQRIK